MIITSSYPHLICREYGHDWHCTGINDNTAAFTCDRCHLESSYITLQKYQARDVIRYAVCPACHRKARTSFDGIIKVHCNHGVPGNNQMVIVFER